MQLFSALKMEVGTSSEHYKMRNIFCLLDMYNQLQTYNERYKIIFDDIVSSNITGIKPLEILSSSSVCLQGVFEIKFLVFQFQVPEY